MTIDKKAATHLDIHPHIAARWSPRAFDGSTLTRDEVRLLIEAARWAPSAYNAQPWQFLVATRDDGEVFERMLGGLNEANRRWAHRAGMVGFTLARLEDEQGRKLTWARHDIGLAMGLMTVQATSMGLVMHQMAGIVPDHVREAFALPAHVEPVTGFVVGRLGDIADLPDDLAERERAERTRLPQEAFVFRGRWGTPN